MGGRVARRWSSRWAENGIGQKAASNLEMSRREQAPPGRHGMKLRVVNADDFGLTEGMNRGVLEARQRGILTSTTRPCSRTLLHFTRRSVLRVARRDSEWASI